eukprot:m.9020 g.9020  ORF g.9020 m.9020 type:complete len:827 (-) comp5414_c0_seq2:325-2805(-)
MTTSFSTAIQGAGALAKYDLDEDTLEYIVSCLDDCETVEDALQVLEPFISDACESESEADADLKSLQQLFTTSNDSVEPSQEAGSHSTASPTPLHKGGANGSATREQAQLPGTDAVVLSHTLTIGETAAADGVDVVAVDASQPVQSITAQATASQSTKAKSKRDKKRQKKKAAKKAAEVQQKHLDVEALSAHADDLGVITSEASRFQRDSVGVSKELYIRRVDMHYTNGPMLLEGAEIRVLPDHRYGLIGRNGCGKTTLLRHLANRSLKAFPDHMSVLYINQEAAFGEDSVLKFVVEGNQELLRLRREFQRLTGVSVSDVGGVSATDTSSPSPLSPQASEAPSEDVSEQLAVVMSALEVAQQGDAEGPEKRAKLILSRLRFTPDMMMASIATLSGGWRTKAAMARALFCPPELLLLDEPTNHLDLYEILMLQEILINLESCMMIVSHDKSFLDAVCTDTVVMKDATLQYFPGSYSMYVQNKEEKDKKHLRLYEAQERKRQHLQATIEKAKQHARRTGDDKALGLVASRKKKLENRLGVEKTEDGKRWRQFTRRKTTTQSRYESCVDGARIQLTAPRREKACSFHFAPPALLLSSGAPIIAMSEVSFAYPSNPSKLILNNVNFAVMASSRMGILGRNGAGKSTLINLLLEKLLPVTGTVNVQRQATIRLYNQHHSDTLDPTISALEHLQQLYPSAKEQELRSQLGSFGLSGALATQPIMFCSGGQKSRICFAEIAMGRPHLLVLDEPTNHLDAEAIEALQTALEEYAGSIVVISHNRDFLESVADELFVVQDGTVSAFEGSVVEYSEQLSKLASKDLNIDDLVTVAS